MMFTTIIIDDEPKSISSIKRILNKHADDIDVVATALSADEAYEKIIQLKPDFIFLDIQMPYATGFDLLSRFEQPSFETIFVTAYDNYAISAIKKNAVDYILKPFTEDDILNAIQKVTERVQLKLSLAEKKEAELPPHPIKRIALPSAEGFVFVDVDDIIRCMASDNYTKFYMLDKTNYLVSKSLAEYDALLSGHQFQRIHQSHLVNMNYVQKYVKGRGGYVIMTDGTTINVSTRMKTDFLNHLMK